MFWSAVLLAVGATVPAWAHGTTERVSLGPGGVQGTRDSEAPSVSADGRFVAFRSYATNLVPGDTNGQPDVFVRDRQAGTTERVSVGPRGIQSDGGSFESSISANGQFVAFTSEATNLVPGDTNGLGDVFVRDRQAGVTRRVNLGPRGVQSNGGGGQVTISADGRFVAFASRATNLVPGDSDLQGVYIHDRLAGTTERVSVGLGGIVQRDGENYEPSLSANGRFVAFTSEATNLVPGDTNGAGDVFVRDRQAGTTRRISLGPRGVQGNGESSLSPISADGRFVAFWSEATNLVPGDTNGLADGFIRDLQVGTTRRVSIGRNGVQGNGRTGQMSISADGRFITFESQATNLIPGDTNGQPDVFVRDRRTGSTRRVSVGRDGVQGNEYSSSPAISADGRSVGFESYATNLVPGDINHSSDVFVRILAP